MTAARRRGGVTWPYPLVFCLIVLAAFDARAEGRSVLEGRIVRALAVHPGDSARILVGNKGKAAGAALVFESRDGGRSWATLNGGAPLDPQASDVQAVAYGPEGVVLAGTWKHGLFVSTDGGDSFARHADFPSSDVRDIVAAPDAPATLYAATGRNGVLKSLDGGKIWRRLGPSNAFFWSLTVSPDGAQVYAVSPEAKLFRSLDGGETWRQVFDRAGAYALAVSPGDAAKLWLATETGLFHSTDQGESWSRVTALPEEKLSSVLVREGPGVFAGAWKRGVFALDPVGGKLDHLLTELPVVHLEEAGGALLVGTWGKGLVVLP